MKASHFEIWTVLFPKARQVTRNRVRFQSASRVNDDAQKVCDRMVATWLAKRARPVAVCDDTELGDVFQFISAGRFVNVLNS